MLGSYRLLLLIKLLLFDFLGLQCSEDQSFGRYRRSHSLFTPNQNPLINPLILFVSASVNDYFTVLNCSTPERVPHHKLDWYFQTRASSKPPRVIWQRGRSNIQRYMAYSPDQFRHFLQIKPIHYNDSGTYMCLDQTSGYFAGIELAVRGSRNCAGSIVRLRMPISICLVLLASFLARYTISESQVT